MGVSSPLLFFSLLGDGVIQCVLFIISRDMSAHPGILTIRVMWSVAEMTEPTTTSCVPSPQFGLPVYVSTW